MTKYLSTEVTAYYGIGNDTVVKGSKVIDSRLQVGHMTLDLYWPVNKSTIID
jgi:hypothetical protein